MRKLLDKPRSAALLSAALALPVVLAVLVAVFEVEPLNGMLMAWGMQGQVLLLVLLGLMAAGLAVSLRSVIRSGGLSKDPANLFLVFAIGGFLATLAIGIVVDQAPCWLGRSNCD